MHKLPDKPVSAGARELEPPTKKYKCEAPIIGGLGAKPAAGSRGRAPGQEVRGRSPLKLKHLAFGSSLKNRKFAHFKKIETQKSDTISDVYRPQYVTDY